MTDAPTPTTLPNLDIGGIINSTFQIYSRNFVYFFLVVFVPYLALQLFFSFGLGMAAMGANPEIILSDEAGGYWGLLAVSILVSIIVFLMIQAVVVRSAVSAKLGRGVEFGTAFRAALGGIIPIALLGILATLAISFGMLLFIVPGLYLAAMFFVMVPAIVFENRGFGGLARSVDLTSGYRWPIVGLFLIYVLISFAIGIIIAIIAGLAMFAFSAAGNDVLTATTSTPYLVFLTLLDAVVNAAVYPIALIAGGMVFVRLREIKEGGETSDLLKVFE